MHCLNVPARVWGSAAALVIAIRELMAPIHLTRKERRTWFRFAPSRSTPTNGAAVTRSHKYTDRDHAGLADGTAHAEEHLPRYFAKSGHPGQDPKATKKDGGGRGNWGREGDELEDYSYNLANARRRSNSSTHQLKDFKTKFETNDEPVFEEQLHGPADGGEVDRVSTTSSGDTKSVDGEDTNNKKM